MSDQPASPSVSDLLLQLMRQQDAGFGENRQSLQELGKTINRIDRDVALVQRDVNEMKGLPSRVGQLEATQSSQATTLADFERRISANTRHVGDLLADSNKLKGMGGPLSKIGVALITALVAGLVGAFLAVVGIRPARAADMRLDNAANAKCWAAPAKPVPKHLYL